MHEALRRGCVALRRSSARSRRLLLFAFGGSTVAGYAPLARALPPDLDVWGVESAGRGTRLSEPPWSNVEAAVEGLLPVVRALCDGPPIAIFGHSMGAILGYEIARRLEAQGARFAPVVLSGQRPPGARPLRPPISGLPREQFLQAIRALGGAAPALFDHLELLELILPALRADTALTESWSPPTGFLVSPLIVYGGDQDPTVPVRDLDGWAAHTTAGFRMRVFAGNHFFFQGALAAFAATLASDLAVP